MYLQLQLLSVITVILVLARRTMETVEAVLLSIAVRPVSLGCVAVGMQRCYHYLAAAQQVQLLLLVSLLPLLS
jgi:hypothetical protein